MADSRRIASASTPKCRWQSKNSLKSNRKDSYFEAHNEREQAGDANRRENVQKARTDVIARTFGPPGFGRFFLKTMKDDTHPEPAGKNGNDSGDETGNESVTERTHSGKINRSILEYAPGDCGTKNRLRFEVSEFRLFSKPCHNLLIERVMPKATSLKVCSIARIAPSRFAKSSCNGAFRFGSI
jgi:hypothetical protein